MRIDISKEEEKAFRKSVAAAMKAQVQELAAAKDKAEALRLQQAIARNSIIFVESFSGSIESDWKKIAADVFLMDEPTEAQPIVPQKRSKGQKKGK